MKKTFFALAAAILLSACLSAHADQGATLAVKGSAVIRLKATGCTLQVGVETENVDVRDAQALNTEKMNAVISALRALGASDDDMSTGSISIYTGTRYENDENGSEKHITVFFVSNTLSVKISEPDQAGMWIDAAVKAGANQIYGLSFFADGTGEAFDKALSDACADAFRKASLLADACGVKLSGIKEIRLPDQGTVSGSRNGLYKAAVNEDSAAGTPVLTGEVTVGAEVEIVWDITSDLAQGPQ